MGINKSKKKKTLKLIGSKQSGTTFKFLKEDVEPISYIKKLCIELNLKLTGSSK